MLICDNLWRGFVYQWQGVLKAINVNKLTSAGCKVKIWIADWFAQLNNKMGGDLKKIQTIGQYLIEIWKALGMNIEGGQVEFLWSSEEINSRAHEYWPLVMDIARRNKLPRIVRYVFLFPHSCFFSLNTQLLLLMCLYSCFSLSFWAQMLPDHGTHGARWTFSSSNFLPVHAMCWCVLS